MTTAHRTPAELLATWLKACEVLADARTAHAAASAEQTRTYNALNGAKKREQELWKEIETQRVREIQ